MASGIARLWIDKIISQMTRERGVYMTVANGEYVARWAKVYQALIALQVFIREDDGAYTRDIDEFRRIGWT